MHGPVEQIEAARRATSTKWKIVFFQNINFYPSVKSNLVNKIVTGKWDVTYNLAKVT